MRLATPVLALAAAGILATPLVAQRGPAAPMLQGAGTPSDVAAGRYALDPAHTQVSFTVTHFGITPFTGMFAGTTGTMTLDPAHPEATALSVSVPTGSVQTTSPRLTEELRGADWLDAGRVPAATFVSSRVTPMGGGLAQVEGTLTLHGVARPATMQARFFGAATNPMSKKASVGFVGRMTIRRSEFGVAKYVPVVSDETTLAITAAFEKQ